MSIITQRKKICNWSLPIFFLVFLINQANSEISSLMPDTNDIKSVMEFSSSIQYHLENSYKLNGLSQSYSNNMNDLREIVKDLRILLSKSELLAERSFDDHLNIFYKIINQLENNSSIEIDPQLFKAIKYRLQVIGSFTHDITNVHIRSNNVTYWCNLANNGWRYFSQKFKYTLNELFINVTNSITPKSQNNYANKNYCSLKISMQRELYSFFEILMKNNLQEYILTTYAWAIKYKCRESSIYHNMWNNTNTGIRNKFLSRFNQCIKFSRETLKNLPRFIYQCDVKEHVRDTTYFELERMWQMFIANEYNLNTDDTCRYDCNFPKNSLVNNYQGDNTQCQKILDCKYLSSPLEVCALDHDPRRLEWFRDADGTNYGSNDTSVCSGEKKSLITSLWWLRSCDYCVCTCKGQKSSEELDILTSTISFRSQTSNIAKNMVVVGIRFMKQNNMIHVQIKEGKILPRGRIDQSTLAWKTLENIVYDNQENEAMMYPHSGIDDLLIKGVDYGYIEKINLDDLMAPKNYLVTGVRFSYVPNTYETQKNLDSKQVELEIQITPFDYSHGILTRVEETRWISPSGYTENNHDEQSKSPSENFLDREELLLEAPDNPTKSPENMPDFQDNQYIRFQASDLKKDAGQSTVPFFDGQPVEGEPAFPLSGIGLFHRGSKGFGGFLSFRIHDLNIFDYMNYYTHNTKTQ